MTLPEDFEQMTLTEDFEQDKNVDHYSAPNICHKSSLPSRSF